MRISRIFPRLRASLREWWDHPQQRRHVFPDGGLDLPEIPARFRTDEKQTDAVGVSREVWIVQRCLSHYRLPLLDRLATLLVQRGLDLKVVYDPRLKDGPPYA